MINSDFYVGQRWISKTEMQFGLGTVTQVEHRTVQIIFPAVGEIRVYAKSSAPLTRVRFSVGDTVSNTSGTAIEIKSVEEHENILTYVGADSHHQPVSICEIELDHTLRLSRPVDRLLSGIIDKPKWFELRNLTRKNYYHITASQMYGLIGTRTSLLPHQLYIANEVAKRHAPRVLLADEVGLGKTIEAGLIIHQQLRTERASRIFIVVPETLTHQWLVEMLRRFNLLFSVYDESRCAAITESQAQTNPFHAQQLILCSLSFLTANPSRLDQALEGEWDILVVDEAHHLEWSPESTSLEYMCIEKLSACTKGVLLLTATPEQLGKTGHFARLRLLDSNRFPDYEKFLQEEQQYEPVANAVDSLLSEEELDKSSFKTLYETLNDSHSRKLLSSLADPETSITKHIEAKKQLVERLIDRHGTGRVLFRNTRNAIKGFPERKLITYLLPTPEEYIESAKTTHQDKATTEPQLLLCPELHYQTLNETAQPLWTTFDPRVEWLADILKQLRPEKLLVITASATTVFDIAEYLQARHGIYPAIFHEGLSIIERDRAAAYFASNENGSQVLICSEIGSEGRNFQFAHHLVLFDIPFNPDLLEQRIGRLDRIGQNHTVHIHSPVLKNSAQEIIHDWYHEGLDAFEHTCTAGNSVFCQVKDELTDLLLNSDSQNLQNLISRSKSILQKFNDELQKGRDRLLEFSSCQPDIANQIIDTAISEARESELAGFMEVIFDNFGIESELHGQHSYIIRPSDHIRLNLPGLTEDGMTITYHRATALANEDMHYLTWEHPIVAAAIDGILSSETGNTAMVTIQHKKIKAGSLFVECQYILATASTNNSNISRYLPPCNIRILVNHTGKEITNQLTEEFISEQQKTIKPDTAVKIIQGHTELLKKLIHDNKTLADKMTPTIITQAKELAISELSNETERLVTLKEINANIREDEIEYFKQLEREILDRLDKTRPQLDALRVIIAT